jgi:uncharacterized damage-inducible protein DinB
MPRTAALEGNLLVLQQGLDLLDRLSDADYRDSGIDRSAVGAQYRHILDHYRCLLEGLDDGQIDYDRRRRDPELEANRSAAARATDEVLDRLRLLARTAPDLPLQVRQSAGAGEGDHPQGSSLGRELLFLVSHTVHHFAIIKLLLAERGVECHPDLGVAPSTLALRQAAG